jgi:hypothetical protein
MKKIIRSGVFETNSSSSHSISVADKTKEFVLDTIYPDQNGVITLTGGEFGWGWFKHNDALTKANYAAVSTLYSESLTDTLIEVIKEQTGAEEVVFGFGEDYSHPNWSYIDHDSVGTCPKDKDELRNFIFNKNSWLFGGNDNSQPDPTFYHVPEYKDGRMISPEFKYELSFDGYKKTTKFITKPNEKELLSAFDSIFYGVYLFDSDNGFLFDNDNSISAQISRERNYFEFRTWNEDSIDFKKSELTFEKDTWDTAVEIYEKMSESKTEDWTKFGHKKTRDIQKKLFIEQPEKYTRKVKFYLKELTK